MPIWRWRLLSRPGPEAGVRTLEATPAATCVRLRTCPPSSYPDRTWLTNLLNLGITDTVRQRWRNWGEPGPPDRAGRERVWGTAASATGVVLHGFLASLESRRSVTAFATSSASSTRPSWTAGSRSHGQVAPLRQSVEIRAQRSPTTSRSAAHRGLDRRARPYRSTDSRDVVKGVATTRRSRIPRRHLQPLRSGRRSVESFDFDPSNKGDYYQASRTRCSRRTSPRSSTATTKCCRQDPAPPAAVLLRHLRAARHAPRALAAETALDGSREMDNPAQRHAPRHRRGGTDAPPGGRARDGLDTAWALTPPAWPTQPHSLAEALEKCRCAAVECCRPGGVPIHLVHVHRRRISSATAMAGACR